jgi:anti-sigma factor (TIGR02949 family)
MSPLDRYRCEEAFRRMDEFLDRELAPQEMARVRTHLETCAACASEYGFEEDLLRTVRAKLQRVDVPPELRDRVADRLHGRREPPADG